MHPRQHCKSAHNTPHIHARLKSNHQQQSLLKQSQSIAPVGIKINTPAKENIKKLPRWKIILLLLSTLTIAFKNTRVTRAKPHHQPSATPAKTHPPTIHNQVLETMTGECSMKWMGINSGRVCKFENKTIYLKALKPVMSIYEQSANSERRGMLSYEHFNRQFVTQCIGAKAPITRFFKFTNWRGVESVYLGGEAIPDVRNEGSIWNTHLTETELGNRGVAKLAVASTFIRDLHASNIGHNQDGLTFIDLDSIDIIPHTLHEYLDFAYWSIYFFSPPLSLDHIYEMNDIYSSMRNCPLPYFHNDFHLSNALYQALLTHYIETGNRAIEIIRWHYQTLASGHVASYDVNRVWGYQLY